VNEKFALLSETVQPAIEQALAPHIHVEEVPAAASIPPVPSTPTRANQGEVEESSMAFTPSSTMTPGTPIASSPMDVLKRSLKQFDSPRTSQPATPSDAGKTPPSSPKPLTAVPSFMHSPDKLMEMRKKVENKRLSSSPIVR
jgi:hypothetical protein